MNAGTKQGHCPLPYLRSSAFVGGCVALCIATFAAASVTVTDDLGRKVELGQPAQRIVSLAPFLTELAYAVGAGSKLVGASAYSDYPPEVEPLAALRPDLVLAWHDSIRPNDVERIERLGIPVFVARARRLEDPPRLAESISRLAGTNAAPAVRDYRERLRTARATQAGKPRVRLFVEVWHKPLTTIGGTHWINEALDVCGADNVFADLEAVAPVVSWEEVYKRDPDAILGTPAPGREADFKAAWRERGSLRAVSGERFVLVDADKLQRPTLRLAQGVGELCASLEAARRR
jgi:iron complex transport system substrate-binding protein